MVAHNVCVSNIIISDKCENYLDALKQCRRTLFVISPDFVHNSWARFESQAAFKEILELKQRVVPVIYRPVAEFENENLKYIMETNILLRWPRKQQTDQRQGVEDCKSKREFWKKLFRTMPKKSNINQEIYDENAKFELEQALVKLEEAERENNIN